MEEIPDFLYMDVSFTMKRNKLFFKNNLIDYMFTINIFSKHTIRPIWDTQINTLKSKLLSLRILKNSSIFPILQKRKEYTKQILYT